jgi:hypothetical protein
LDDLSTTRGNDEHWEAEKSAASRNGGSGGAGIPEWSWRKDEARTPDSEDGQSSHSMGAMANMGDSGYMQHGGMVRLEGG